MGGAQVAILRGGEYGVTILSLHPNVSSNLEGNVVSPFVGPSLHLHSSLR
jgi:hypothetical protein